ncbi:citrate synthase [Streptomyces lydicus]|uniref:citrate synthase n=1 Tax=Streptomyces lydicus TaxID=47763 RepID=UPI000525B9A0|nr:citrate synthase [Streptomyces lydicus]UEG94149.1 helix-turn-helix domain-containing protein [Streptomyces lydicus]
MTDHDVAQDPDERRLSTREAADRLGVKPETVYAYVSRGQLTSRREPGGRGSTFDAKEVDALARRGGRREPSGAGSELAVRTGITLIDRDHCYFRGVDTSELAAHHSYEEVAEWLWTGEMRRGIRFTAPHDALTAARRAVDALPAHTGPMDRLQVAVIAAAAADPLRFDLSERAVLDTARTLIPTLVAALPRRAAGRPPTQAGAEEAAAGRADDELGAGGRRAAELGAAEKPAPELGAEDGPLAPRLWSRLTSEPADPPSLRVLDAALVLLIDHDLAASTLAVRVAASARAHPYAIVSAGFGALDGALHGAASGLAHRMLLEVLDRGSAAAVVADHLRAGRRVPGLGHPLYPGEDPRARALFALLEDVPRARPALQAARDVITTTARHKEWRANVDLALAVLTVATGMPAEAGETIFAVARTAGWIAHALEEYDEPPLRMRPSGQYSGPRPPQPLP